MGTYAALLMRRNKRAASHVFCATLVGVPVVAGADVATMPIAYVGVIADNMLGHVVLHIVLHLLLGAPM